MRTTEKAGRTCFTALDVIRPASGRFPWPLAAALIALLSLLVWVPLIWIVLRFV